MTAIALRPSRGLARPAIILGGLAASVGLRWVATVSRAGDAVAIGLVFGLCLVAVGLAGGWRPLAGRSSPIGAGIALGVAGGAALVGLAIATRSGPLPSLAPAATFAPWALVTVLVASGEELVLRGALFDELDRGLGVGAAVLVTSVVFAVIHVPLYGWHVVPLDLGVGLWLAGLRLAGRGIAAPAIAHTIADLATWWL
jgi:membrane protease YdiL (CAAX protease family)